MARVTASFVILVSFVGTALTVANAFFLKKQFYPSVVYLTKSSTSMAVIYFQAAVLSYLSFTLVRWIFFGQLRAAEVERAQERIWHAIMETCLAFTVFRDDFSPKFVIQFVVLFFVKAFHWLADDRVDYMERSPLITLLFHTRMLGILSLLSAVDSYFISHAFFTTLLKGASAQIVFGFEYAILITVVAHITIKYVLHIHDLRSPHPWENKAVFMLYAELFTSFLRCVIYLVFAAVMIKIHTFPLFSIRPFYLSVKSFQKAVSDVILSRRAINAMNNLFPLATEAELTQGDNTCIICREEMTVESGAKKLPCNHIFHPNCLRSWFQRQQTCPTCRTGVFVQRRPTVIPGMAAPQVPAQAMGNAQLNQPAGGFNFNANILFGGNAPNRPLMVFGHMPVGQPPQQQPGQAPAPPQQPPMQHPAAAAHLPPFMFHPQQLNQFMVHHPFAVPPPHMMGMPGQQQMPAPAHAAPAPTGAPPPQPTVQPQQQAPPEPTFQAQPGEQAHNPATEARQPGVTPSQPSTSVFPPRWQPSTTMHPPPSRGAFLPGFQSPFSFPPPPTFAGLSDAEIAEMEGNERRNIEARLQVLRNISVLLDAAMLQLQQYMSIAPQLHTEISRRPEEEQGGSNLPGQASNSSQLQQPSSSMGNGRKDASVTDPTPSGGNNGEATGSGGTAEEDIRRRRLAKFEQSRQDGNTGN